MTFPEHISRVLEAYGIRADTKAALYELYLAMGDEVLEVFADFSERAASPDALGPEHTLDIRQEVIARYLRRNHPRWVEGRPTPSLWHPRVAEGRASGAAVPLGEVGPALLSLVPEGQPLMDGLLMLGRNAHAGGRQETVSFDVVARDVDDAIAIGQARGRQHTLPGSVGETSATYDSRRGIALIWEIQPNVLKPAGERNRGIVKLYRRHRNWHLVTLGAAMDWLAIQRCTIYVLRGDALAITHEVRADEPLSAAIAAHHDRTIAAVAAARGLTLDAPTDLDELRLLDSEVMNHALRRHVLRVGADGAVWRIGGQLPIH